MAKALEMKLEINLKRYASVALASELWNNPLIKKEIKQLVKRWKSHYISLRGEWAAIVEKVSQIAKSLELPEGLLMEIENILPIMGDKIYYWINYMLNNKALGLDETFLDHLFWTNDGFIDEDKIFKQHWEKMNDALSLTINDSRIGIPRIFLACIYAQTDYIKKNRKVFKEGAKLLLNSKGSASKCGVNGIMTIFICAYMSESKKQIRNLYESLQEQASETVASRLFRMCTTRGLVKAAKYFWNKIKDDERKALIEEYTNESIRKLSSADRHEAEKKYEILIFLLNNMSESGRFKYVEDHSFEIILMFLHLAPQFCEMFKEILNKVINTVRDQQYLKLVLQISLLTYTEFDIACYQSDASCFAKKKIFYQIIEQTLNNMTKEDKITELLSSENSSMVWKLYNVFAIPILALIFNDEDLADYKEDLFESGILEFKELIMTGDFTRLDNFFQIAFKTKEERKAFKQKINFYPDLVYKGEFKLADEFLDWIADCDEEKARIKMELAQITKNGAGSP